MNKLIAQLTKELKRSPLKAAALGGGTLLAVWFWLPLINDWFGSEAGGSSPQAATAETTTPPVTAPVPVSASAAAIPPIEWRQLVAWKESNGYSQSYVWPTGARNPFISVAPPKPVAEVVELNSEDQLAQQQVAREQSAQEVAATLNSLQLTSTLIMSNNRSATINGKVYREGDRIEMGQGEQDPTEDGSAPTASPDEQSSGVVVLRHVASQSVTLQFGSELFPLRLKRPTSNSISLELR